MKNLLKKIAPCIIGVLSYFLLATLVKFSTGKDIHHWVYDFFKRFMY